MHSGCSRNFLGRKVEAIAGHSIQWPSEGGKSQKAVTWWGQWGRERERGHEDGVRGK